MLCFFIILCTSSILSGPVVLYCIFLLQLYSLVVGILGISCLPSNLFYLWLNKDIDLLSGIDKYNEFAQHRNGHGGGIKVYIRNNINVNVLKELCNTKELYESFVCEVIFPGVK